MSDDLERLAERIATDLGEVRWADGVRLRTRARRRTVRAVVAAPVAVAVLAAVVWGLLPAPRAAAPDNPTSSLAPSPSPSMSRSADPAVTRKVVQGDPAWFSLVALLQPADVGDGVFVEEMDEQQPQTYGAWPFPTDGCPAYAGPRISTHSRYRFMRWATMVHTGPSGNFIDQLGVQTRRYTTADAVQVVEDTQSLLRACARYDAPTEASSKFKPAHAQVTWTILAQGFAGDQSLLVRMRSISVYDDTGESTGNDIAAAYAIVRVGDLVAVIVSEQDDFQQTLALAKKAGARLCEASATC